MLLLKDIKKEYSNFELKDINLQLEDGEILGLIGENGAGKTTLLKIILGIIVKYDGLIETDIKKEDIGIVLENIGFPILLTPSQIEIMCREIYREKWNKKIFNDYIKRFDIPEKPIKDLSTGMKKKLEIIVALSHMPKMLILDEPTNGLDPVARREILELFLEFSKDKNHTIIFSSHETKDLENISTQLVFLHKGKKILDERTQKILENYKLIECTEEDLYKINKKDIFSFLKENDLFKVITKKEIASKHLQENIILDDLMYISTKGEIMSC